MGGREFAGTGLPLAATAGNHTDAMSSFRVLVTGAVGFLGPFVVDELRRRGHEAITTARSGGDVRADLTHDGVLRELLLAAAPDAVVHLAAMSKLSDCNADPSRAQAVNAVLPAALAERLGPRLLVVSTDLVFDGRGAPYASVDPPAPLSAYGVSKAEGEAQALARGARVVRLPLLFGPDPRGRGATAMIRQALGEGRGLSLYTNEYRTPLHAADAAAALCELALLQGGPQLVHVAGAERVSRWELGLRFCQAQGLPIAGLQPIECMASDRPRDVSLRSDWPVGRDLDAMLRSA